MKTAQSRKEIIMTKLALHSVVGSLCLLGAAGCAHQPPKELLDARAAYEQSEHGLAATQDPAALHTAHSALEEAEASFNANGADEHTRDLAYIAQRKAQIADVQAQVAQNESRLRDGEQQHNRQQGQELTQLRGQYQTQQQQLATSEAARSDAEQRAKRATEDLSRIASVKQEPRGTVITLSGEVLFASGKAILLPGAQAKLSEVATALTQQDQNASILVEGHTDSQGNEAFNLDLSTRRAEAVRDYLSSHGVAADRIRAEGLGFSRPLGDNKTAEGRANNRRVEIVVDANHTPRS
jgi:outer membrane protein OmpA-like peptidoglycan-associated protein